MESGKLFFRFYLFSSEEVFYLFFFQPILFLYWPFISFWEKRWPNGEDLGEDLNWVPLMNPRLTRPLLSAVFTLTDY